MIKIRILVPNDVYGIRAIQRETWLKTYPNKGAGITTQDIEDKFKDDETPEGKRKIEERKKKYGDKNTRIWVAEDKDKIVGFCTASRGKECNRIEAIYVLPDYQGKGLGSLLMEKGLRWLGDKKDILVNVARYNKQAIGFYKKFGFIETGKEGILDKAARLPSGKFIPEIELIKKIIVSVRNHNRRSF